MKKKLALVACCCIGLAGCAVKEEPAAAGKDPEVTVSCIGVLPARAAVDMDETVSPVEAKQLEDGSRVMDGVLKELLGGRSEVRFVSTPQVEAATSGEGVTDLESAKQVADRISCNVLMETTVSRYVERVGGQYGVKEPAAATFDYRLYEVGQGRVLCRGRFDEQQQSLMDNLLSINKASGRGFTWVTAEQLLREGMKHKLGQCPYFPDR
jgi:hypothetical protein